MEERGKKISEIVRSTVKEILEPGIERSTTSGFQETGKMDSDSPF